MKPRPIIVRYCSNSRRSTSTFPTAWNRSWIKSEELIERSPRVPRAESPPETGRVVPAQCSISQLRMLEQVASGKRSRSSISRPFWHGPWCRAFHSWHAVHRGIGATTARRLGLHKDCGCHILTCSQSDSHPNLRAFPTFKVPLAAPEHIPQKEHHKLESCRPTVLVDVLYSSSYETSFSRVSSPVFVLRRLHPSRYPGCS